MKPSILAATALCALLSAGVSTAAHAANLMFSFSNTIGSVNGTVTGEIFGLDPNGTSAATDVIITSYPSALVVTGSYPTPIDVFAWSGGDYMMNSFTLANGEFVDGGFILSGSNSTYDQLWINGYSHNYLDIGNGNARQVWNTDSAAGVTFTQAAASVPEPASLALLGLGVAAIGTVRRRRA